MLTITDSPARDEIVAIVERHGGERTSLIPILQDVKTAQHEITDEAMQIVADLVGVHPVEVFSVATFYAFLHGAPEGRFVVRALVPHGTREDVSGVSRDLLAGRIGSLHAFKVRLLMALHPSPEQGTRLADAWDAWQAVAPDPRALATELGWKLEALATIAVYRDSPVVYAFPTVEELDVIARRAHLARDAVQVPRYELGDRCPTITWRKR